MSFSNSKEIFRKNSSLLQFFITIFAKIKRISFRFQFSVSKTASKGIETWKDVTCFKYRLEMVEANWQPLLNDATICYANQSPTPHHVSTLSNWTVSNGPSSRTPSSIPSIYLRLSSDISDWNEGSIGYNASGRAKSVRFTVRSPLSSTSLDRPVDWHRSMT